MTGTSAGASPPWLRRDSATARPLFLPTALPLRSTSDSRANSVAAPWHPAHCCTKSGRVVTCAVDPGSNRFYQAAGFACARTFQHHGRPMHEYLKALGAPPG